MEHAEMSINANAMGSFAGIDANKKALIGENSEMESGYVSNWSISHSHVTASSSGLNSSAKWPSVSYKKSVDLETISENNELKDLQETPTTQSIRTLNEFHINTPNAHNQLETTPKKGNYFSSSNHYGSRSGSKRNRSSNEIPWSSRRSGSLFFESIDENSENIFPDDATNACNQSIGVSPIKPHNISHLAAQPLEKSQSLQRHPSGIESSTPKMTLRRTRTQSIVKPKVNLANELARDRLIRKAQSFSPVKRSILFDKNQRSINLDDIILEDEEQQPMFNNPAQKFLDLSTERFNQFTQQHCPSGLRTPTKLNSDKHVINDDAKKLTSPTTKPLKRLETHKSQSRLVKEFSGKRTLRPMVQTSCKNLGSLNESDIVASLANENETDLHKPTDQIATDDSLMDISDPALNIQTPSTNIRKSQRLHSDTPMRDDLVKRSIREDANRTPTKRFEKSTSHSFLSTKSSPEKEKHQILYGHLPCTPPKNRQRRQLKRPARTESPLVNEPSAKRKLYDDRPFMAGIEEINMLKQLQDLNLENIIYRILVDLPDESLLAAASVCQSWKAIVEKHPVIKSRYRRYVRAKQMSKENVRTFHDNKSDIIDNNNTKPLHLHNTNYKVAEKPAPVSPSTRRFIEHQQIIQHLKPEQRVLQCPRCNGASIVHPVTQNEAAKPQRRSPRRLLHQTSILQDRSLRSSFSSAIRNKRIVGVMKVVLSEYAACSKKACGYEFCTNCNCNRHVNGKCTKRPLGSSPKSDEDSPYKPEPPRNMRRETKSYRLRRLDF